MRTRDITLIALFAALVAVLAQVSIPLPFTPVPITGQVLGVLLAGAILGKNKGTLAMVVYLLLGAIGLPVFARSGAGLAAFASPSGGYLWGFILGVYAMGLILEMGQSEPGYLRLIVAMLLCLVVVYTLGTLQLMAILHVDLVKGLFLGVIPYIPLDLAKLVVAAAVGCRVRRALRQAGFLVSRETREQS
ncbi:biotin transporter BioY [Moorella sp. Hama-1]|uniref:biotin transporter BioY n=1 Tax=Moorella sp. Hama-1 TaxID=2138101 RepID=UPI000D6588CF|nr:biotin transporter BioY [Moorella sp. Hama-1]MDN5362139.1 biotin transport system substrate-specific component [Moorella sp. (in: firmicutes)]BCV20100.1 biotin transporter BioY [Moorella sp. Hama-1]